MENLIHEIEYRGRELMERLKMQRITICGAGAIGSNLVENLVRQGFGEITVIDYDRVASHNRHTQIWNRRDIGQLKVIALRNHIFNIMERTITSVDRKLEKSNIKRYFKDPGIIVDGFDNSESRALVTEYCHSSALDCLHVGLYQDCAEVCWNEQYRVPDVVKGMDVCEYPLARNVIMIAVAVASDCIIRFLEDGAKENYFITLKDFKITKR